MSKLKEKQLAERHTAMYKHMRDQVPDDANLQDVLHIGAHFIVETLGMIAKDDPRVALALLYTIQDEISTNVRLQLMAVSSQRQGN